MLRQGFVAAAIASFEQATKLTLTDPFHLAISYDEEIGCIGVRSMIEMMAKAPFRPKMCIVGEPTEMGLATGHKGKTAIQAICHGLGGHSALALLAMNALHLACDLTAEIRHLQDEIAAAKTRAPNADIAFTITNSYPGLETPLNADIVTLIKPLTGANTTIKVAFGTEGGLFSRDLGIPTIICGPSSMDQGHKPDEFVTTDQLALCDDMLAALNKRLVTGL